MKSIKFAFIGLFVILLASFSSCSSDDKRWIEGKADFSTAPTTYSSDGTFGAQFTVYNDCYRDLGNYNIDPGYVYDYSVLNSSLIIASQNSYGRASVDYFSITISGVGTYEFGRNGESIPMDGQEYEIKNSAFQSFMANAMSEMYNRGYINVIISGETSLYGRNEKLYFDFLNDVDFYVKY